MKRQEQYRTVRRLQSTTACTRRLMMTHLTQLGSEANLKSLDLKQEWSFRA